MDGNESSEYVLSSREESISNPLSDIQPQVESSIVSQPIDKGVVSTATDDYQSSVTHHSTSDSDDLSSDLPSPFLLPRRSIRKRRTRQFLTYGCTFSIIKDIKFSGSFNVLKGCGKYLCEELGMSQKRKATDSCR